MKRGTPALTKAAEASLFQNMAFAVSYSKDGDQKSNAVKHIKAHGGLLLGDGFEQLFISKSPILTTPTKSKSLDIVAGDGLQLTAQAKSLGFVCLIADRHSRKAKFMQALALDLPCISGRWIEHSVNAGSVLDWTPYLLAA